MPAASLPSWWQPLAARTGLVPACCWLPHCICAVAGKCWTSTPPCGKALGVQGRWSGDTGRKWGSGACLQLIYELNRSQVEG